MGCPSVYARGARARNDKQKAIASLAVDWLSPSAACSARRRSMPRVYKKGVKRPSPSGLPCFLCGNTESSSWRGPNSRWCARTATGCKEAGIAASAAEAAVCVEAVPPPFKAVGTIISAPCVRGAPIGDLTIAMAVPLLAPSDAPLAEPPVALVAAVAAAATCGRAAPAAPAVLPMAVATTAVEPAAAQPLLPLAKAPRRVPLGTVDANARPTKKVRNKQEPAPLSAYEMQRDANVQRNQAVLRELGLVDDEPLIPPKPPPQPRVRKLVHPLPTTRMLRPAAGPPGMYAEHDGVMPECPSGCRCWLCRA